MDERIKRLEVIKKEIIAFEWSLKRERNFSFKILLK